MKSYKPNFIIIIFIILLILASISIFIYFNYPKLFKTKNPIPLLNEDSVLTPKKEINSEENQKETKNEKVAEELKLQEQTAEIIKTNNYNECDKIEDAMYKKVCINNIALKLAEETLDISHCQKLDNELVPRDDCERNVIASKSIKNDDISACLETKNQELQAQCQDNYYIQLSQKKDDIGICEQASAKEIKDLCYNTYLINKNFSADKDNFDCSTLRGIDEQADCNIIKEQLKQPGPTQGFPINPSLGMSYCPDLKTDLFTAYCLFGF